MGIYDRDYYRGDSERMFASLGRWSATVWLIVITCAVFLAQVVTRDISPPGITKWGAYDYWKISDGEVWRLLTAIFLHDTRGLLHLVFNMLMLYWFGRTLEERYGSREFILFYIIAGTAANLGYFLLQVAGMEKTIAIGASGAVTAVMVLYALHYPRQQVLLFFVIPMPIWGVVVLFIGLDVLGVLGVRQGPTAFAVHLLGALLGFLYYRSGIRFSGLVPSRSRDARVPSRPRLRVVPMDEDEPGRAPPPEEPDEPVAAPRHEEALESKLDRVLEKVSQHGQESLSGEEREILFRASEVYKKRRK